MEICANCPMKDERYTPSDQVDKATIRNLRLSLEATRDFVMWLFEESEHCDHIPYSEAWEEFEKWEAAQ